MVRDGYFIKRHNFSLVYSSKKGLDIIIVYTFLCKIEMLIYSHQLPAQIMCVCCQRKNHFDGHIGYHLRAIVRKWPTYPRNWLTYPSSRRVNVYVVRAHKLTQPKRFSYSNMYTQSRCGHALSLCNTHSAARISTKYSLKMWPYATYYIRLYITFATKHSGPIVVCNI